MSSHEISLKFTNNDTINVDIVAKIIKENKSNYEHSSSILKKTLGNNNSKFKYFESEKKSNNEEKYEEIITISTDSEKFSKTNKKQEKNNKNNSLHNVYTEKKNENFANENSNFKKNFLTQKSNSSKTNSNKYFRKALYRIGSKYNPHPPYPPIARKKGWEGYLILKVFVNRKGIADKIEIIKSSGYKILDEVSLKTIRSWVFIPAKLGTINIEDQIQIPIRFILNS